MTKTEFLKANPDIKKYLKNDTELREICTADELSKLDYTTLPKQFLCSKKEYDYTPRGYTLENYKRMFLYMIIKGKKTHKIHYKSGKQGGFTKEEVDLMQSNISAAFDTMRQKYIGYLGAIGGIKAHINYKTLGKKKDNIVEININVELIENYKGAIKEVDRYTRLCGYVIEKLKEKGKITDKMSDYDKARVLYNWVNLHITYDKKLEKKSQSGMRGLVEGTCVCNGYTSLYNSLCELCGIEAYSISGKGGKTKKTMGNHIWSYIIVDGKKIFIDSTWGSVSYDFKTKKAEKEFNDLLAKYKIDIRDMCNFEYFDMSIAKMKKEHLWDNSIYNI